MQDKVLIRPVASSDYDDIEDITREVFEPASIDALVEKMIGGKSWLEIKMVAVRRELESAPHLCAVAEFDGKVVGYVTNTVDQVASRGIIANLAVSGKAQGLGLGRKLMQWSLDLFRSLNLQQAKIETLATNEVGRHLYPTLGFREIVQQVHYIMPL